jgi:invasion protein IalB
VLDAPMMAALRQGTVLLLKATAAEGLQEAGFKISLNGFASALARAVALAK